MEPKKKSGRKTPKSKKKWTLEKKSGKKNTKKIYMVFMVPYQGNVVVVVIVVLYINHFWGKKVGKKSVVVTVVFFGNFVFWKIIGFLDF